MLLKPNTNVVEGTVLDANGQPTTLPTEILSLDEVRMLREYKKFLRKHQLREALFCQSCFQGDLHDGMEAYVTDGEVMMKCRHRMIYFKGASY